MPNLPFTVAEITKILDGRLNSPIQDVVDDVDTTSSRKSIAADTPYTFTSNGGVRNHKMLPAHITNIWDTASSIASFSEFMGVPEMVANIQFMFDPSSAVAGNITVSVWVHESVPVLMKSVVTPFKSAETRVTSLITFYAGEATEFDVKNKGVFFTYEMSAAGELWDRAIEIYRT